jgi:HSP20 family protein
MLSPWKAFPVLDRLFDDVMSDVGGAATSGTQFSPAIDVRASDDQIVFVCDVPGVKDSDLDVTIDRGVLTIKGERRYEGNEKDRVWLGRGYGAFTRSFTLPDSLDAEKMSAELANGVLTIKVPKTPKSQPRRIAIGSK